MAGSGFDSLLGPLHSVPAREVAELELLRLTENLAPQPRGPLGSHRDLVHVEIDEVAALVMRGLERLLDVEQEPGEVLAQAHCATDEEKLLRQGDVALLGLDVTRDREARRVAALPMDTRVVEANAPRLVVVLSNDARGVVRGHVRGSADS